MPRRLSLWTKFAYGLGSIGEGMFQSGYEFFAFFYFVQVLGMRPILGGIAMLLSTLLDAVTDPLIGSISDKWRRGREGRRHPFMYASIVPFAVSWYLLLSPPNGLDSMGLFWWFLGFSILLRQSVTFYQVPHSSLGAELSDDYQERSSIAAWRIIQGFLGTFGCIGLFTVLFFPETPEFAQNGLLNPAGYPLVAFWGAALIVVSIGISAIGTRDQIPRLLQPTGGPQRFTVMDVVREIGLALKNPSFRALVIGVTFFVTSFSINEVFGQWVRIFFWGLTSTQIGGLLLPTFLGFIAFTPVAPLLHRHFDKKPTVIVSSLLPAGLSALAVSLKLLGVIPDDPKVIVTVLSVTTFLAASCAGIAFISAASMMADVTQEVRVTTGRDLTGIMFAGHSFAQKFASAIAHFAAAVLLEAIGIVPGADVPDLDPITVTWIGASSLVATGFAVIGIACYSGYRLTRARHLELSRGQPSPAATDSAATPGSGGSSAQPARV